MHSKTFKFSRSHLLARVTVGYMQEKGEEKDGGWGKKALILAD